MGWNAITMRLRRRPDLWLCDGLLVLRSNNP
jgi:hypothetical protein